MGTKQILHDGTVLFKSSAPQGQPVDHHANGSTGRPASLLKAAQGVSPAGQQPESVGWAALKGTGRGLQNVGDTIYGFGRGAVGTVASGLTHGYGETGGRLTDAMGLTENAHAAARGAGTNMWRDAVGGWADMQKGFNPYDKHHMEGSYGNDRFKENVEAIHRGGGVMGMSPETTENVMGVADQTGYLASNMAAGGRVAPGRMGRFMNTPVTGRGTFNAGVQGGKYLGGYDAVTGGLAASQGEPLSRATLTGTLLEGATGLSDDPEYHANQQAIEQEKQFQAKLQSMPPQEVQDIKRQQQILQQNLIEGGISPDIAEIQSRRAFVDYVNNYQPEPSLPDMSAEFDAMHKRLDEQGVPRLPPDQVKKPPTMDEIRAESRREIDEIKRQMLGQQPGQVVPSPGAVMPQWHDPEPDPIAVHQGQRPGTRDQDFAQAPPPPHGNRFPGPSGPAPVTPGGTPSTFEPPPPSPLDPTPNTPGAVGDTGAPGAPGQQDLSLAGITMTANLGQIPEDQIMDYSKMFLDKKRDELTQQMINAGMAPEVAVGAADAKLPKPGQDLTPEQEEEGVQNVAKKIQEEEAAKNPEAAKDPNFFQQIWGHVMDWWNGADNIQKIGAVLGLFGAGLAIVNALFGGDGMTTAMGGLAGLGGAAAAMHPQITDMFGFGQGAATTDEAGFGGQSAKDLVTPNVSKAGPTSTVALQAAGGGPNLRRGGAVDPVPPPPQGLTAGQDPKSPAGSPAPAPASKPAPTPAPAPQAQPQPKQSPEQMMADIRADHDWLNTDYGDAGGQKGVFDSKEDVSALVTDYAWPHRASWGNKVKAVVASMTPEQKSTFLAQIQASDKFRGAPRGMQQKVLALFN